MKRELQSDITKMNKIVMNMWLYFRSCFESKQQTISIDRQAR